MFNLVRLLENDALKMFSIRGRRKSKHKFGGNKICKAEELRKYFFNPKTDNSVFSHCAYYIICSLHLKKKEAVVRRCSSELVFLKISQENTCAGGLQHC